jgi:outer membrane protein OmpA-like peptidoglycan-associated protein
MARQQAQMSGRDAELARQEAQARARESELAQKQSETRAQELEALRQQSETRIRELDQARLQAEQAAAQNQKLEVQLSELKARQTERGLELTLSNVLFDFDKATLKPGGERSLGVLVDFLKANPTRRLTVEGHTDSLGADSYNLQLSQQRANAVRDWFTQNSIGADRITAQGMGENYPLASNDSEAGRQENRRVQIIITTPEQTAGRASR